MPGKGAFFTSACVFAVALVLAMPASADDPVLQGDMSVEAGVAVAYPEPGKFADACAPPSGTAFAVGATLVTCKAPDASNFTFTVNAVDTTPPELALPAAPAPVEATSAAGAPVAFGDPSATDLVGPVTVGCDHHGGETFPVGETTVTCTAQDAHPNVTTKSFVVTVTDKTPPELVLPAAPAPVEATTTAGAPVAFGDPSASDLFGPVTVGCNRHGGETFAVGETAVVCTAQDAHSNVTTKSFVVTVTDKTPPELVLPAVPASVEATSAAGAPVAFGDPSATDLFGPVTVGCNRHGGEMFPVGITTVVCTAQDAHSNVTTKSFAVTVADKTPPTIAVPASIVVQATGSAGAVVAYGATALDLVDGPVAVACLPASGSLFPVGVTTVKCNAKDAKNNAAVLKTFTVSVTALPEAPVTPAAPTPPTTTPAPFQPPAVAKPSTVSGFAATPGDRHVVVKWKLPAGAGLHVELQRAAAGGKPTTIYAGRASSFVDKRLRNGSRYQYSIVVVDADGSRSESISQTVSPNTPSLVAPTSGALVKSPPTLKWVPAAKATYYNVQLYRNGEKVLSLWPGANQVTLKRQWVFGGKSFTLVPGDYRWFVWPGYGPHRDKKYGSPLGNSSFKLSG